MTPASGMQPIRMTSTASQGFPPSSVASSAITATYGGVLAAVPIPAGWKPCRYSDHSPDAPPQAGTSAPPPSGLELSSERSATRAIVVRTRNSSTPGLVSTRCTMPVSTSSESSSMGSSVAWWLPTTSTGRDFDSAPVANSASLRNE